jgi:multidrug efflux pump subunit AcrA (membrane-fusion protein)
LNRWGIARVGEGGENMDDTHTSDTRAELPTYTTTGGYVELRAPIDGETYEGRAVYAAAQRAAQAMADETQADVEIYAAEGYVMSVATPGPRASGGASRCL